MSWDTGPVYAAAAGGIGLFDLLKLGAAGQYLCRAFEPGSLSEIVVDDIEFTSLLVRKFSMVPGEPRLANTRWSSSQTVVVPLGERFGEPSALTVAMKPILCCRITRFMSSFRIPMFTFSADVCRRPTAGSISVRGGR